MGCEWGVNWLDPLLQDELFRTQLDGLDEEDQLVPPGIYIVRYKVDADAGGSTPTGLVSVAY